MTALGRTPGEVCAEVLALVRRRLGPGAEAEVTAWWGRSALTRFANSHIHQNVADDHLGARLRLALDGRVVTASTGRLAGGGLERLVATAAEIAGLGRPDPGWPGVAPASPVPDAAHHDEATATAEPHRRAEVAAAFIAAGASPVAGAPGASAAAGAAGAAGGGAVRATEAAGFCSTGGGAVAFANTAGHEAGGAWSGAEVSGVHRLPGADGGAGRTALALGDLDGAAVGAEAADRARRGIEPVELAPGSYEVILLPSAVADVVGFLGHGFNARRHAEGTSHVELGATQLDPAITLVDDAGDRRSLGVGFDAEGTPRRRLELVRRGVSVALAHDRRTAAAAGTASTGHAVPGGEASGPEPGHLLLEPGPTSLEAMIATVERGLLVTDLWYTRVLDPKTQVVTGLTRNGTFLVEAGRLGPGVANLRFTQSYVEALAPGNVLAVGGHGRLAGERPSWVPALHLGSWRFTGGAAG